MQHPGFSSPSFPPAGPEIRNPKSETRRPKSEVQRPECLCVLKTKGTPRGARGLGVRQARLVALPDLGACLEVVGADVSRRLETQSDVENSPPYVGAYSGNRASKQALRSSGRAHTHCRQPQAFVRRFGYPLALPNPGGLPPQPWRLGFRVSIFLRISDFGFRTLPHA